MKLTRVTRSYCATQGVLQHSSCRSRETNEFSLSHWLEERVLTGITESFPTFNHTASWTTTCAPGECATAAHECSRGIVRGRYGVSIRFWTHQLVLVLDLFKKCANFMTYQMLPVLDFFKSFILARYWLDLLKKLSYKRGTGFLLTLPSKGRIG
jgi:hypothetical protein